MSATHRNHRQERIEGKHLLIVVTLVANDTPVLADLDAVVVVAIARHVLFEGNEEDSTKGAVTLHRINGIMLGIIDFVYQLYEQVVEVTQMLGNLTDDRVFVGLELRDSGPPRYG